MVFVDFVGLCDYVGVFVVIVGFGIEIWVVEFEVVNDDYFVIMFKLLVDCLVEVVVEWFYLKVCIYYWGYVIDEKFDNNVLIVE